MVDKMAMIKNLYNVSVKRKDLKMINTRVLCDRQLYEFHDDL